MPGSWTARLTTDPAIRAVTEAGFNPFWTRRDVQWTEASFRISGGDAFQLSPVIASLRSTLHPLPLSNSRKGIISTSSAPWPTARALVPKSPARVESITTGAGGTSTGGLQMSSLRLPKLWMPSKYFLHSWTHIIAMVRHCQSFEILSCTVCI